MKITTKVIEFDAIKFASLEDIKKIGTLTDDKVNIDVTSMTLKVGKVKVSLNDYLIIANKKALKSLNETNLKLNYDFVVCETKTKSK